MVSKKMIKLSTTSIIDEKSILPTEVKQNIENDYSISDQVKSRSTKVASFLTQNNITYDKISNYEKKQSQKDLLMRIKNQTDWKIDKIENWNAQTQEEKEAKAYYMSKHLDANILQEKFPNMMGRATDASKLTNDNVGSFDYDHTHFNWWESWTTRNPDNHRPYTYNAITSYSSSSLERCGIDNNYIAICKKMSDLKLMIGDWPWIDDTINVFMNNCEVLEYVTLNKIQHEAQSLSESDIEFLIKKEMNESEYKDIFNLLMDEKAMHDIANHIVKTGAAISVKFLLEELLKVGEKKLFNNDSFKTLASKMSKFTTLNVDILSKANKYLIINIMTDIISSFSSSLYQKIKLLEIQNSSQQVLDRLNSTFDVKIDGEKIRSLIKAVGSSVLATFSVIGSFSLPLLIFSIVDIIKQFLLVSKMTYTIKPSLDSFINLLKKKTQKDIVV